MYERRWSPTNKWKPAECCFTSNCGKTYPKNVSLKLKVKTVWIDTMSRRNRYRPGQYQFYKWFIKHTFKPFFGLSLDEQCGCKAVSETKLSTSNQGMLNNGVRFFYLLQAIKLYRYSWDKKIPTPVRSASKNHPLAVGNFVWNFRVLLALDNFRTSFSEERLQRFCFFCSI